MKAVVVLSGGLDSTVAATMMRRHAAETFAITIDYGQRHVREIQAATEVARYLGIQHKVVDLSGLRSILGGSALTDDIAVPHGHYADDSMRITVVPNRNAILLSVACGWAGSLGADTVVVGVHAGDHPIYPDCRPEFISAFSQMEQLAMPNRVRMLAPFVNSTKTEIVSLGARFGAPFNLTWSCYEGGEVHCGLCGTCVERREAFALAGVDDPTTYATKAADPS